MPKKPHPLTDEMIQEIGRSVGGCEFNDSCHDEMRAAADWQLKQVKERVAAEVAELRQYPACKEDACTLEFYFESILKDLRPQEDN